MECQEDTRLSDQELRVLRLLCQGKKSRETADVLFISKRTVDWHTASIFRKLNVHNRVQALVRAQALGLL